MANDLILEAGDECAAAECKRMILTLAAFKCLVTEEALEVNVNFIAELSCSVFNSNNSCVLLSDDLDLLLYILVSNISYCLGSLDAL